MFFLKFIIAFLCSYLVSNGLYANNKNPQPKVDDNRIAIVVGKKPITVRKIKARARFMRLSQNPNEINNLTESLLKEAAKSLVYEQIQKNTCDRIGIKVSDSEINKALEKLAQQNSMGLDEMRRFFESKGILFDTLKSRIYTQLAWPRAISSAVQVIVSDRDVQKKLDEEKASWNQDKIELAEIVMYGTKPEQITKIKKILEEAKQSLKTNSFSLLAQQISESPSSVNGGNIGWVTEGALPQDEEKAVKGAAVGTCVGPVTCSGGYRLLYIIDRQSPGEAPQSQSQVSCTVARLGFSETMSEEEQESFSQMLEELAATTQLKAFEQKINDWKNKSSEKVELTTLKPMPTFDMPPEVARLVESTQKTGVAVGPLRLPNQEIVMVFISARNRVKAEPTLNFAHMQARIYQEELEKAARKEFNKLLSHTPVEYHLPEYKAD